MTQNSLDAVKHKDTAGHLFGQWQRWWKEWDYKQLYINHKATFFLSHGDKPIDKVQAY